ncbi:MAG TPA: hypothetical protein VI685_15330 [Candidatus Angelobacter sp.]
MYIQSKDQVFPPITRDHGDHGDHPIACAMNDVIKDELPQR